MVRIMDHPNMTSVIYCGCNVQSNKQNKKNCVIIPLFLLNEAVLTTTRNLYFKQKKKNACNVYPCKSNFYHI